MFIGQMLCLMNHWIIHRFQKRAEAKNPFPMSKSWYLILPAACDFFANILMSYALIFVPASVYQMLRGSIVLFTAFLSKVLLGRRLFIFQWLALVIISMGIALVGLGAVLNDSGTFTTSLNVILGIFFLIVSQGIYATQAIFEEKILGSADIHPMQVAGLEGVWGLLINLVAQGIVHPILGVKGEPGNMFDFIGGLNQTLFVPRVFYSGLAMMISVCYFGWFSLEVTHRSGSTVRMTIDACRYSI